MRVFEEKNGLELEILGMAVCDRAQARIVMGICDRAGWYHGLAFTAIEQVAKHGRVLDHHVRDQPDVKRALGRRCNPVTSEDLEQLCWNHCCITNSDTQMTLLRITARPGYEDLRIVLEAILRGNLETLEAGGEASA